MKVEVEWQDIKTLTPLLEHGDKMSFLLIKENGEGVSGFSFKTGQGKNLVIIDGNFYWGDLDDSYTKWCLFPFPRGV